MDDQPPPPYSESASTDHGSLSLSTQNITAYRTIIPSQDLSGIAELAGHNAWSEQPSFQNASHIPTPPYRSPVSSSNQIRRLSSSGVNDLALSGFVSALPYFELRDQEELCRPADTNYHHMIIGPHTLSEHLSFPQPSERWLQRGVDSQDWATFLNHLFPHHGVGRDEKSPAGRESNAGLDMGGLSLEKGRSRPDESRPLLGEYSAAGPSNPPPQSSGIAEEDRLRRMRIGAVTSQWNEGFFEPRGLCITTQFTIPLSPTSPLSPRPIDQRRRSSSNVLQKAPPPRLEETLLHQAVAKGSKSKVREALEQGDDLEALNKKSETPLFRAVVRNEKAIVQILLDKGANPAARPIGEFTPLQHAASRDKKSLLKLLVEKCNLVEIEEVTPAGETALYLSVKNRYNSCIEVLLEHGANINSRPIAKESMLNVAVSASQSSVVKLLLQKGAFLEERNKDGDTPLGRAVQRGETKIVKLLLVYGASVTARTGKGEAPLSVAVSRGDTSIVALLLGQPNIDVEVLNLKGESSFYRAISRGDTSIVGLLLQKGANPDTCPPGAESALNYVVSKGNTSLTHLLVERGVDPEVRNKAGETPLFKSVSRGDVSICTILIGKGADVNTKNASGEPVLYKAVSRGDTTLVSILLAHGANPEVKNPSDETCLYRAVYRGETSIVSLLLAKRANPETPSPSNETPLFRAIYRNDTAVVSLLLGSRANPLTVSGSGESALEYAAKKGNKSIVNILQIHCPPTPRPKPQ